MTPFLMIVVTINNIQVLGPSNREHSMTMNIKKISYEV